MIVYRLCKSAYSSNLTGKGAEITGGRWNGKGVPMLYTSASRALCTIEIAVHTPLGNIPTDYKLVSIKIPDVPILDIDESELPSDWNSIPHSGSTQKIGDEFIKKGKYLVMKVPSASVRGEFNYLVNPGHGDMKKVKIEKVEPFTFDERLFRK